MNKYLSVIIDQVYQKLTNEKTCSLLYKKEIFDGVEYDSEQFFNFTKKFFDKPELFYKKSQQNDYNFELNLLEDFGSCKYFSFESPFTSNFETNNTAYFRYFSKSKSKTLLIFSPGWARPNLKVETKICEKFAKNGIDCVLPIKPFHQERTPDGFYSGELFISANQLLTVANFRQYVSELRNIITHYRSHYQFVGIVGMSSGGFQAGLLTNTEIVDFYFPFITGARLGSITWDGTLTKFAKRDLLKKGVNREGLNKIWAIADQFFLGKTCKAKYIKQYISKYDQVVPTKYQIKLNEIYNCHSFIIKSAHTSVYFELKKIIDDMILEIRKIES